MHLVRYVPSPRIRTHDDTRHAMSVSKRRTIFPVFDDRRLDVIVEPTPIIPDEEECSGFPLRTVHHSVQHRDGVIFTHAQARWRMPALGIWFVEEPRIQPGNVWESPLCSIDEELIVAKVHDLAAPDEAFDAGVDASVVAPGQAVVIETMRQNVDVEAECRADVGRFRFVDDR